MDSLKRAKLIVGDYLKYNSRSRAFAGSAMQLLSIFERTGDTNALAKKLLRMTFAARLLGRQAYSRKLEREITKLVQHWSPAGFHWDRFFPDSERRLVQKAI